MNNNDNINLDIPILGFLVNQPKHGYELFKELSDSDGVGMVYRIKIGRLYAILKKLEARELIRAQTKKAGSRPPRNIYYITKKGKELFLIWMGTPIDHGRDFRVLFLIKLFFIKRSAEVSIKEIFSIQKEECKKWLEKLRGSVKQSEGFESFEGIVKQYRISQIKGFIQWIEWCEEGVEQK